MRYHIVEVSTPWEGQPYSGASLSKCNHTSDKAEAPTYHEAKTLAQTMHSVNGGGWDVYDSQTGEKIYTSYA